MENVAIELKNVSKVYRLHQAKHIRLLEMLGLGRGLTASGTSDFWALRGVSLQIAKGTTVGILGKNGAGKSTLLRMLAGTSQPTDGEILRHGTVAALLELGTGFHPDLSGHENIFASGLYLGFDREAMQTFYDDIVGFAEIGSFLHQPVRTYSSGMHMRLAFAVATCLPSDIHIVDEVLGVGDAYFFSKCLRRFRRFQAEGGTTVLVSHDHAAMLRLCDRCVWIDRGAVVADGPAMEVISTYTESVYKEQDKQVDEEVSRSGNDLAPSKALRATRAVTVETVYFVEGTGRPITTVRMGDRLGVQVTLQSKVLLENAVVSLTVFRIDGVTVCNTISALDGVLIDIPIGKAVLEVWFDQVAFAPGEYIVSVGVYPSLDLADPISVQHAVISHQSRTIRILPLPGVSLDLGVFRPHVRWETKGMDTSLMPYNPIPCRLGDTKASKP